MFLSCAAGELVKTFELSSQSIGLQHTSRTQNAEVTCVRYNHNGKILASCSIDGSICLGVASSGELLSRFFYPAKTVAEKRVNSVQFSGGSRFLVSGGSDGFARVWDLKTQEVKQEYNVSASAVTCVSFAGFKDDCIVAGSECGAIGVFDVQCADNVGFLAVRSPQQISPVNALQSSPHPSTRSILGACYGDGSVRVWDVCSAVLLGDFQKRHQASATCIALSPVSKVLLASGGLDGRVLFFDTHQKSELRNLELQNPVTSLALHGDGKTFAVGTKAGEVLLYDLRGAISPMYAVQAHESAAINSLQFASIQTNGKNAEIATVGSLTVPGGIGSSPAEDNGNRKGVCSPTLGGKIEYVRKAAACNNQQQPATNASQCQARNWGEKREEARPCEPSSLYQLAEEQAESPQEQSAPSGQKNDQDSEPFPSNDLEPVHESDENEEEEEQEDRVVQHRQEENEMIATMNEMLSKVQEQNQTQQEQLVAVMQVFMEKYHALAQENQELRRQLKTATNAASTSTALR